MALENLSPFGWNPPPESVNLMEAEVHVWKAGLDLDVSQLDLSLEMLAEDERSRANSFHFSEDRQSYIAARSRLRQILARYLRLPAGDIRFLYTPEGKPWLDLEGQQGALHFNLSHSGALALIGIAAAPVGVDLELVRADFDFEGIVAGFFTPAEQAVMGRLGGMDRRRTFYRLWTRKESYQKARGVGLGISPEQVPVIARGGRQADGHLAPEGEEIMPGWWFFDLDPQDGYVAALAIAGRNWGLHCFQFE